MRPSEGRNPGRISAGRRRAGRRAAALFVGAAAVLALGAAPAGAADARLVDVGAFDQPVFVTGAPGDDTRLYVVQQTGVIRAVVNGTQSTFLDIDSLVQTSGEQGLLSMAFAPDYATSRRFYVYYVDNSGNLQIDEFQRDPANAGRALPGSRRGVLSIAHPVNGNHNGGQLQFGPDGYLYIGTGDGGGGGDPDENAQDLNELLGKLLRIDPRQVGAQAYTVPASNPFAGATAGRDEIWAYGLRNPWRFSFDRGTGDLVLGDVGQGSVEEVDFRAAGAPAGANFGWDNWEGSTPFEGGGLTNHVRPVFEYSSAGTGNPNCSVTGGYVVRDPALPALAGRYLYADFCAGALRTVQVGASGSSGDRSEDLSVANISSFGQDGGGCLYTASLGDNHVRRVASLTGAAPVPCAAPFQPPPPPPPPPPGPPPPPPPPGGTTSARANVIAAITPLIERLRRYTIGRLSRWPTQSLRFTAPRAGTAEATLVANVTRRLRTRTVAYRMTLGRRTVAFPGAGSRTLTMSLSRSRQAILRRPGTRLRLDVRLTFAEGGDALTTAARVAYLNR